MMEEDSSETSSPSPSPIEPHRNSRSSSEQLPRKRRSKDGAYSTASLRDVARVLITRERETSDLKRTLYTLSDQLKAERQRADAAENKTREVLDLFKKATNARLTAEQEAARANEALRLYKIQYENAQQELRRAQKLIDTLEAQRIEAEDAAARARSVARKAKEEALIMSAREAGRRQGLEEGMAQGRIIGYEEGRAAGYQDGMADTERAYAEVAMSDPYVEDTPRQRRYQPPRVSRPSTSEDSEDNLAPNYTQPMDDSMPIPPPVTTPARIPTPAAAPAMPRAESPKESEIRPIPIHTAMASPSHPAMEVPPDGWIPKIDEDQRIRLPPPHEMGPPPPTTPSPPLSAVLNNVKNIEEPPPVVIPPPLNDMRMPEADPNGSSRRPRHRRRNSNESQSTTMSQFEILGPPSTAPSTSTLRGTMRERRPVLSAISEERERSSVSSPIYGMPNPSTQSFQMPSPAPQMPTPSPAVPMPSPQPPPPGPAYPTPDSMGRYRSTDSLSRSSAADGRYPGPEQRSHSRAGSADEFYRSRGGNNTPRYASTENLYRPAAPEGTPRYDRGEDRPRSPRTDERSRAYGSADDGSHSGSVRGYPSRDNLTRASSRSDLGRRSSVDNASRSQNIYAPPRSPHSSPESPTPPIIIAPSPSLRPPAPQAPSNRGSMSSNEINFTIVPPSRPESNISRIDGEAMGSFLSAEDAERPLPPLPSDGAPDPSSQPPAPSNPVIPPTVMLSGPFPPPGFVPTGPPSPSPSGPGSVYGGSTVGPAGVPLPPSTVGGTPSVRSEVPIPGGFPGAPEGPAPVIPLQPSSRSSQSGSSRRAREPYSRTTTAKGRDDDSDSTTSSGLGSADSLTTPPPRTRKLSGRSTPAYAAAPLPPNVNYPVVPPTPRSSTSMSLGSHTSRAARVPLPPSAAGSAVGSVVSPPGSAVGYPTAPTPLSRRTSVVSGVRPPSEMGRPRSPLMGASPNRMPVSLPVAEPVIPIPIPEPPPPLPVQIIPMPSSPAGRSTTLGDLDLDPVPVVARAPSPSASATTAATSAKGKKGKKKGKGK